jgi:uncharacterized protein YacL
MSLNLTVRLTGMVLFAAAGLLLAQYYIAPALYWNPATSFNELVLPVTLFSALLGLLLIPYVTIYPLRWMRNRIKLLPAQDLLSATVGLFVGLVLGAIMTGPLSALPGWGGQVLPTVATLLLALLGIATGVLRRRDLVEALRTGRRGDVPTIPSIMSTGKLTRSDAMSMSTGYLQSGSLGDVGESIQPEKYLLVDTSAIIDGRIADISKTGFIDGILLVPQFVLNELQHIADSADALRRARGRRGLDMINRLQKEAVVPIQMSDVDAEDVPEVDGKLVKIARIYRCPIITNDFNLNRVAEIQGVKVLNINELANAVKPVVLPGEEMHVHVIQEGKEFGQGVAYLDDGTMVVVENGKRYMNSDVDVVVTRVLQTVAGRMIFAQMKNGRA